MSGENQEVDLLDVINKSKKACKSANADGTKIDNCDKLEEDGITPNKGNGCDLQEYSWIQSLSDLEITIPLNINFRARRKDVVVKFTKKHLTVGFINQIPIIIDDKFEHDIKVEESTWVLQDGKTILLILGKVNKVNWWSKIVVSDPKISIDKIKAVYSEFRDFPEDMQGAVEKMLYDKRQSDLGLPSSSSEDQKKQEKN